MTDKGTGDGVHLVGTGQVFDLQGQLVAVSEAGKQSAFTAQLSEDYLSQVDPKIATTKHAHSQNNPEKDWGLNTLQAIELAFHVLNKQFPEHPIVPKTTTVIAASWSNGGRAVLMATEQDKKGLIDAVVAVEPSTAMDKQNFTITQGERSWGPTSVGWSLFDFHAFGAIYQPCANNLAANDAADLINAAKSPERCTRLQTLGLLTTESDDLQVLAQEAQDEMNTVAGFLPEQNLGIPPFSATFSEITNTYGNSYGRFSLADELCGISFATYDKGTKEFSQLSDANKQLRFVGQNMVAGGGRWIQPFNTLAEDPFAATAFDSTADKNLDADLCFYAMSKYGHNHLQDLGLLDAVKRNGDYDRVQAGIREAHMDGKLNKKPAIIIHGRSDQIVAPNHGGRAYYARNRQVDNRDNVVYWEVENGHHLEMFGYLLAPNLGFYNGDMKHRYGYIHPYFEQAMDEMFAHLADGSPLSPSQVIRTEPMLETGLEEITESMFGPIQSNPGADSILWEGNTLVIPD
mgnify:FL=1